MIALDAEWAMVPQPAPPAEVATLVALLRAVPAQDRHRYSRLNYAEWTIREAIFEPAPAEEARLLVVSRGARLRFVQRCANRWPTTLSWELIADPFNGPLSRLEPGVWYEIVPAAAPQPAEVAP
jgi:hypothetical protein